MEVQVHTVEDVWIAAKLTIMVQRDDFVDSVSARVTFENRHV